MIKVTIERKDGRIILVSEGHARSGDEGKDLVCAAVSAIILGGANALEDDEAYEKPIVKKGYFKLVSKRKLSEHDEIVLETVLKQIESIARDHPQYVMLERK